MLSGRFNGARLPGREEQHPNYKATLHLITQPCNASRRPKASRSPALHASEVDDVASKRSNHNARSRLLQPLVVALLAVWPPSLLRKEAFELPELRGAGCPIHSVQGGQSRHRAAAARTGE